MTGCYKCGSPQGNEARLCSSCNEARLNTKSPFSSQRGQGQQGRGGTKVSPFTKKIGIAGLILIAISAVLWNSQSYYRMRLGIASAEDLYKVCNDQRELLLRRVNDPLGKAVGNGVLEGMCDNVRSVCSSNPSGIECQRYSKVLSELTKKYWK
jgi:hypothetical protein